MKCSSRHLMLVAIFALLLVLYFFSLPPRDGLRTQRANIVQQFSSSSVSLLFGNPQLSLPKQTWRDYYDEKMEIQKNNYAYFLSEVSLKNRDLGIVVDDYVAMIREYCGYEFSENGFKNTFSQSQMFSFLLAIRISLKDTDFRYYSEVVKAAHNSVNCSDENEWIINTKNLL